MSRKKSAEHYSRVSSPDRVRFSQQIRRSGAAGVHRSTESRQARKQRSIQDSIDAG